MGGNVTHDRYMGRRCCECKFFHMANCDPKTQRCKKYNKPVRIFDEAADCKGFRIKGR